MLEDTILELTKLLIEQDLKDKENGMEYIKISKQDLIRLNIDLIKLLQRTFNK